MRLVRTWPRVVPDGRAYVVDTIEHVILDGYDHTPLAAIDDDILLLEWDIALSYEDLRHFREHAWQEPGRVLVAPYRLYIPFGVWAHRQWHHPAPLRPIRAGDTTCQLFGFGVIYLPRGMVNRYMAEELPRCWGDVEFSMWHYKYVSHDVPVCWDVCPVHLHYPPPP